MTPEEQNPQHQANDQQQEGQQVNKHPKTHITQEDLQQHEDERSPELKARIEGPYGVNQDDSSDKS